MNNHMWKIKRIDTDQKFPSESTRNLSPVCTHPSINVSLLAFSLFQYPMATLSPRSHSSPVSSAFASVPSSRIIRASIPGIRIPVEPVITVNFPSREVLIGWPTADIVYGDNSMRASSKVIWGNRYLPLLTFRNLEKNTLQGIFHEKMNEPSESDESLGRRDTNLRDDSGVR